MYGTNTDELFCTESGTLHCRTIILASMNILNTRISVCETSYTKVTINLINYLKDEEKIA